jgi:hypothetical protein
VDDPDELLSPVLLEEVAAAFDRRVGLSGGAGDALQDRPLGARRDGVLVAERAQDRAVESLEDRPCRPVGGGLGVVG